MKNTRQSSININSTKSLLELRCLGNFEKTGERFLENSFILKKTNKETWLQFFKS